MDDEAQHGSEGGEEHSYDRRRSIQMSDGEVINRTPLGRPVDGHGYDDIAMTFEKLSHGGRHTEHKVKCFRLSLELNARAIHAHGEAARDLPLSPQILGALGRVSDLSEKTYSTAVAQFTGLPSIETHAALLRDEIGRAAAAGRLVQELERRLRIRKVLHKGLRDATLLAKRFQSFKRENILKDRHPGDAVLVRTFTPFLLPDPELTSAEQIGKIIEDASNLRSSSEVEPNELKIMAFDGQVNAALIYLDFDFMTDLLDLTVHAGAYALGARRTMKASDAATFQRMLCDGGEDVSMQAARPGRAKYARALRARWREVPSLAASTEYLGHLKRDD